ncbi:MAG: 30S ribosomal protein S12 methylthiotransferase RimO [Deltaproteobacteria bacterium]|nr:30S ribosomal protein S12 methylthiotransferase RimO [Deltaproteobacteria bacterium]MBW2414269.1 30S ribosomal protein S12 methylthiotransferase RimO [Deltaproteobacteria bacterium]
MEPSLPKARVFFRSLGCPKNRVDSELMLGALALGGYAIAERIEDADVAVINTCSFIETAREESIDVILDVADLKQRGELRALVVAGCLPQRYGRDLARELPEVDAFVGTGDFPKLVPILERALEGRGRGVYVDAGRTHLYDDSEPRMLIGGAHSAYLKIAEGCDRVCTFCAIPSIRGRFQSRAPESILREAHALASNGALELILVSQDTNSYGKDLARTEAGRPGLAKLVRDLDEVETEWIRLLYLYPSAVDDELIDSIAGARRVLPYLDIPLQHASDPVLRAMRRGVTAERHDKLLGKLRERIPGAVLRTTFIVGFPGETDRDFETLCDFVREHRFDRLGVFRYSDEEGTGAFDLAGKVPRALAMERHDALHAIQSEIMAETLALHVGREEEVLIDSAATGLGVGRLWSQAPEIDGQVRVRGDVPAGSLVRVRITATSGTDFEAVPVSG